MSFNRAYVKEPNRFFTPVYTPTETYSFYINSFTPITDPDGGAQMNLYIVDRDGVPVYGFDASDHEMTWIPFFGNSSGLQVYCTFVCPEIPNGEYYLSIRNFTTLEEQVRSNPILIEHYVTERTVYLKYRNTFNKYGYNYQAVPDFYNMVRIPLIDVSKNYDSTLDNYRNVTDDKFRVLNSLLDSVVTFEAYYLDEIALDGLAAMLDHDEIYIDEMRVVVKTQLQVQAQPNTNRWKGTFEIYPHQYQNPQTLDAYGQLQIMSGTHIFIPDTAMNGN